MDGCGMLCIVCRDAMWHSLWMWHVYPVDCNASFMCGMLLFKCRIYVILRFDNSPFEAAKRLSSI